MIVNGVSGSNNQSTPNVITMNLRSSTRLSNPSYKDLPALTKNDLTTSNTNNVNGRLGGTEGRNNGLTQPGGFFLPPHHGQDYNNKFTGGGGYQDRRRLMSQGGIPIV